MLRRFSGGGAVVLGPGCLNYAVVLSLVSRPELTNVAASFQVILGRIVAALGISGLSLAGGDGSRAGRAEGVGKRPATRAPRADPPRHAVVRVRSRAGDPLPEGAGPPAGIPRGAAPRRVHRKPPAVCRDDSRAAGDGVGRLPCSARPAPLEPGRSCAIVRRRCSDRTDACRRGQTVLRRLASRTTYA